MMMMMVKIGPLNIVISLISYKKIISIYDLTFFSKPKNKLKTLKDKHSSKNKTRKSKNMNNAIGGGIGDFHEPIEIKNEEDLLPAYMQIEEIVLPSSSSGKKIYLKIINKGYSINVIVSSENEKKEIISP